jgi:hypothetical protein
MYTSELIQLLKKDKYSRKSFCGVVPYDKLPIKKLRRPCSIIINTQKSTEPGEHWVAIYLPRRGKIEYFDSYGFRPTIDKIYHLIKLNGINYVHNDKTIQGVDSKNCGLFTLFYIYFRARGYSIKQYLKFFITNKIHNDIFIKNLFNRIKKQNNTYY